MENFNEFFEILYKNFNDREIDLVIENMAPDIKWANGMEGGYVYGHTGVREYWTKQFKMVSSNVTPLKIEMENGEAIVKVHQVVYNLEGKLLSDTMVEHVFTVDNGKIAEFNIR